MAKYQRTAPPKNFNHKVTFDTLNGGKADVTMKYVYRTSSQHATFVAEMNPQLLNPTTSNDLTVDVVEINKEALERNARYIMGAADGWDLEMDFTQANILQFCDEEPAGAQAIIHAYRMALTEGRAKN